MSFTPTFTEDQIAQEIRLLALGDTWMGAFSRRCVRIFIRSLRVYLGFFLFLCAMASAGQTWEILGRPFSEQSFLGILGGLLLACLAYLLFALAWLSAFGEGPSRAESIRQRALASLTAKWPAGFTYPTETG